jgi:hypothetical protein
LKYGLKNFGNVAFFIKIIQKEEDYCKFYRTTA